MHDFRFNIVVLGSSSFTFNCCNISRLFNILYDSFASYFAPDTWIFFQLEIHLETLATGSQTLLPLVRVDVLCIVQHLTSFASRWTATVMASLYGPYPERSMLGSMSAVMMSTSVATLTANVYSGAYTISTPPSQQSRLLVESCLLLIIAC